MKSQKRITAAITLHLVESMKAKAHTYDELVAISGLTRPTVGRFIKQTRALGMVRIAGWKEDVRGYPTVPLFGFRPSEKDVDCARPTPKTAAQRMAATRAARKAASDHPQ